MLLLGSDGKTQIATEYIFMNINGLLSAIGGNLGMFLGFSAFSIYQMISNKLRSLLWWPQLKYKYKLDKKFENPVMS